ncbi:hypothetical protein [Nostoc sp. 'Peltigera membranacea cyanobiont' N6]|uniref:hypothetical protein n=1 Tax=Nostoc sp. 'Peltigera membranacea cyanobiont' N6 TaxID=1261031 RepID=UPI000D0C594C|nr:hypothetical protein [Nostoc sp. 'Peltigera membranacea cyanobiont' N6]AVH63512.1 hypothetical protein NPM_1701 [Nostoc sp. 'Peltigera membranacea cyanobiont' N6]
MSIKFGISSLEQTLGYVTEAALELFSPNHDSYPAVGVQPFSGEPWKEGKHHGKHKHH